MSNVVDATSLCAAPSLQSQQVHHVVQLATAHLQVLDGEAMRLLGQQSVVPTATSPAALRPSNAGMVAPHVPRLLINRELVGDFDTDPDTNRRDAVFLGDCDAAAWKLAGLLGWEAELEALVKPA